MNYNLELCLTIPGSTIFVAYEHSFSSSGWSCLAYTWNVCGMLDYADSLWEPQEIQPDIFRSTEVFDLAKECHSQTKKHCMHICIIAFNTEGIVNKWLPISSRPISKEIVYFEQWSSPTKVRKACGIIFIDFHDDSFKNAFRENEVKVRQLSFEGWVSCTIYGHSGLSSLFYVNCIINAWMKPWNHYYIHIY